MRLTYQNVKQKVVLGLKNYIPHCSTYPVLACGLGHRRRPDVMYASQLGAMLSGPLIFSKARVKTLSVGSGGSLS